MSPRDGPPTSTSTDGTAWPWILEHFLTYPGTFEIPLRTMFAINLTPTLSSGSTPEASPSSTSFPGQYLSGQNASDHFKECLLNHLKQLPSRQVSLPASFISSYVRKCFPQELCDVDFTMALTALDYLKDLESRRRRELAHVFERLGLDKNRLGEEELQVGRAHLDWAVSMQGKDKKVESLYTEVYVGLRRWILINEMKRTPFSKASTIAMLNTLYPPTVASAPTRQLAPAVLTSHRSAFFRYIQAVEKNGNGVLRSLEHQGQRSTDEKNGWPSVRDTIDKYLRTSNSVIDECVKITGPEYFTSTNPKVRPDDRADSAISFRSVNPHSASGSVGSVGSAGSLSSRPSTGTSGSSERRAADPYADPYADKSLPPAPRIVSNLPPDAHSHDSHVMGPPRKRTALEKMMRGILVWREDKDAQPHEKSERVRTVKKTKSSGALRSRPGSGTKEPFEITEEQRQRLIYEAQKEKNSRAPSVQKMSSASSINDSRATESPEPQMETDKRKLSVGKTVRKMQSKPAVGSTARSESAAAEEPFELSEKQRKRLQESQQQHDNASEQQQKNLVEREIETRHAIPQMDRVPVTN